MYAMDDNTYRITAPVLGRGFAAVAAVLLLAATVWLVTG